MSEEVKSKFLGNTTINDINIVDHHLTGSWQTIYGDINPNINNDSLIAYWRFYNDDGGTFTEDSSGNSHVINWTNEPSLNFDTPFKNKNSTVTFDGTNDVGVVSDHDDLSFGDSANDSPFSISFWIKQNPLEPTKEYQNIINKLDGVNREYAVWLYNNQADSENAQTISFFLYDSVAGHRKYSYVIDNKAIVDNLWHNITITYNGNETLSGSGITIYLDGHKKSGSEINYSEVGTYTAMHNTAADITVGGWDAAGSYLNASLAELAIWNRELNETEVKALHDVKHGVFSNSYTSYSPRIALRDQDNHRGQYPTIKRIGDKDRSGEFDIKFNDENTILFKGESDLNVQVGLPANDPKVPSISSDISTQGRVKKGIGDQAFNIITPGQDISAFNDTDKHIGASEFYLTGTDQEVYPNFSSPLGSKTSFTFDITANEEQYVFRQTGEAVAAGALAENVLDSVDFRDQDFTGFCYYAFGKNKWEQVGLTNPEDGSSRTYRYAFDYNSYGDAGPETFPSQFAGQNNFYPQNNEKNRSLNYTKENLGYDKTGLPTISSLAPWGTQYHATSSQVLSTSDIISSPFLLEKINISLPVHARQLINGDNGLGVGGGADDMSREMTNYVVFLYLQRQNTSSGADTTEGVSSSERVLIASSSVCFYNSNVLVDNAGATELATFEPIHDAGFSHGFTFANDGNYEEKTYDGIINLEFTPAIASSCYMYSRIPRYTDSSSTYNGASTMYSHFWPGGNNIEPFQLDNTSAGGKDSDISLEMSLYPFKEYVFANSPTLQAKNQNIPVHKFVKRHVKNYGPALTNQETTTGDILFDKVFQQVTVKSYSQSAPFILLPGDQLVLGIDRCVGDKIGDYGLVSQQSLSGSLLKIKTDPASMTFYGSLIKENKEYHENRNQDLTSNAIHEALYSHPTVDQFEIEPISVYSGSFFNEYLTGSFKVDELGFDASRRVVADAAAQSTSYIHHNRGFRCADSSEVFYDTVLPDMFSYARVQWPDETVKKTIDNVIYYDGPSDDDTPDAGAAFWQGIYAFPFAHELNRGDIQYKIKYKNASGGDLYTYNANTSRTLLFMEGFSKTAGVDNIGDIYVGQTGGCLGFKHGVRNTKAYKTTAFFRSSHYGHLRDMLEQRQFGRFSSSMTLFSITGDSLSQTSALAPVESKFVESLTETIVDPETTTCSNMNLYSTSSLPFFDDNETYNDGNGRNRSYSSASITKNRGIIPSSAVLFDITT